MAALTTEQLDCLLRCVIPNAVRVLGVFPANCIPIRYVASTNARSTVQLSFGYADTQRSQIAPNEHCCFILNTHPSDQPGEHWLAFLFNANTRKLEYFDSFGLSLAMYSAVNAALLSNQLLPLCVRANSQGMLQSLSSTVCGHYCIAYLHWRAGHTNAHIDSFAHSILVSNRSPSKRDKLVVVRMRTLTNSHPCCATQLFGSIVDRSSMRCTIRSSQSCCCGARYIR